MKLVKFMCGIALGVAGTLLYQRYGDSIVKEMDTIVDKTVKKIDEDIDECC